VAFAVTSVAACHRYESVSDLQAVAGTRGRITLTAEGRANNARRLGGVALDVSGTLVSAQRDSVVIRADDVRFADLGSVPFAQGELRFASADVASVSREVINRRKTALVSVAVALGALFAAELFTPNTSIIGFGRGGGAQRR
jgi:hypothetical protein